MPCMVVSSWVSQVYSSLKPWFLSLSMLCLSRWSQRLTNDVFEQLAGYRRQWNWSIVLRFAPVALLEHAGDVCSQPVDGSCPVCTDGLKLQLSAGTVVFMHSFSTLLGILSGPHALDRFRFQRGFAAPSVLMTKSILGMVQIPSWAAESLHLLRIRSWTGWEGSWPWWCCHWREQCLSSGGVTHVLSWHLAFHVPPEWLGVVSLPSLFNHSVHMLVLCFPYLPSTIFLEVPIVPQVAVFLGLLEESFIPSQEFLDVLANPREISVSPAECWWNVRFDSWRHCHLKIFPPVVHICSFLVHVHYRIQEGLQGCTEVILLGFEKR